MPEYKQDGTVRTGISFADKVDAHDGTILYTNDGVYRYAMSYTDCIPNDGNLFMRAIYSATNTFATIVHSRAAGGLISGFHCAPIIFPGFGHSCGFLSQSAGQTVKIFRTESIDLDGPPPEWTEVGDVLGLMPQEYKDNVFFRPAVIYNERTKEYVMWVHMLPASESVLVGYKKSVYLVAKSKSPNGPFENFSIPTGLRFGKVGDMGLVTSETGEGYLAYASWENGQLGENQPGHMVAVQKLTADYTDVEPAHVTVTDKGYEAPSIFRRGEWYYLLSGFCCCFCKAGSNLRLFMTKDPMGEWSYVRDLNPKCREKSRHIPAQSNFVFQAGDEWVWTADHWESGSFKGRDMQHWEVLNFEDLLISNSTGNVGKAPVPGVFGRVASEEVDTCADERSYLQLVIPYFRKMFALMDHIGVDSTGLVSRHTEM